MRPLALSLVLVGLTALRAEEPSAAPAMIAVPRAVGVAPLADDLAAVRDRALLDAKRNAVEAALGTMVRSETEVKDYQLVRDQVTTNSQQGFVFVDEVLEEKKEPDDGAYVVAIKCRVSAAPLVTELADRLPQVYEELERPRALLLLSEKKADGSASETISTLLTKALSDRGLDLVDRQQIEALGERDKVAAAAAGNADAVQWLTAQMRAHLGAELLVNGTATAGPGMADAALRIYNSFDARILGAAACQAPTPEALVKTLLPGPKSPEDLVNQLLSRWLSQPTVVTVNVQKPSFSALRKLESDLKARTRPTRIDLTQPVESSQPPELAEVTRRSFNPAVAVLELRTPVHGSRALDLVADIFEQLGYEVGSFDGFRVDVVPKAR